MAVEDEIITRIRSDVPDFDYSTPEAQQALANITELILELEPAMSRKLRLYERTLGLAVAPVLLRRTAIVALRRIKSWRQSS